MKPRNALADEQEATHRLEALADDRLWGLVAVPLDSEGIIDYLGRRGASRVGNIPALEVPSEDPSLVDEEGTLITPPPFRRLVQRYGCDYVVRNGFTYVYAAANVRPTADIGEATAETES